LERGEGSHERREKGAGSTSPAHPPFGRSHDGKGDPIFRKSFRNHEVGRNRAVGGVSNFIAGQSQIDWGQKCVRANKAQEKFAERREGSLKCRGKTPLGEG